MTFAGMNYLAVLVAAAAAFAFGAAWYTILGKPWIAAARLEAEDMKPSALPFVVAAASHLVMAWVLAGLLGHMGSLTLGGGVVSAAFVWLGFVLTTIMVNHRFQGATAMLTVIDAGHWLGVLVLMGAIIGWFGV
jgi:hypothetical protein